MGAAIRILGLDPGLARMGWGMVALAGTRLTHIGHGVITTRTADGLGLRLLALHRAVAVVIAEHKPDAVAVEQAFVAKDPGAALK
ncbi:MAG TPA: crossover junction endodeoxyribonuclease RuvC, partial [Rhizomicrobium sp.]|nr:crossover junction endodeoxyribonuclease RuvC [Rhizomicrobium sp.]